MKIVHFESGLGNQMLDYVDYLAICRANPDDLIVTERMVYDISASHQAISMWNGYELREIFGLDLPNLASRFDASQWAEIMRSVTASQFWAHGWNLSDAIVHSLQSQGMTISNSLDRPTPLASQTRPRVIQFDWRARLRSTRIGGALRSRASKYVRHSAHTVDFKNPGTNELCGHTLKGMYKGYGIDLFRTQLLNSFRFPDFAPGRNVALGNRLSESHSVSVHIRRGDYLGVNGYCYTNGYFKRAVKYMKKHITKPFFAIFSEPGSRSWINAHLDLLGLDQDRDEFEVVDWNSNVDSYRDMQLMSLCSHNIITESSFGWWGSYLNNNPSKQVVAPNPNILATVSM